MILDRYIHKELDPSYTRNKHQQLKLKVVSALGTCSGLLQP